MKITKIIILKLVAKEIEQGFGFRTKNGFLVYD